MSTDPPPEGCPLCGSTWGDWWEEVQGKLEFFCCEMCARQWATIVDRVKADAEWPRVDRIEIEGNRWGRTCEAYHDASSFRFFVLFTPEGELRRFDALEPLPTVPADEAETVAVAPPPDTEAAGDEVATPESDEQGAPVPGEAPPVAEEAAPVEGPPVEEDAVPDEAAASEDEGTGLHPLIRERIAYEAVQFPDLTAEPLDEARLAVRKMVRETDDLAGGSPAVAMLKTSSFPLPDHRVPVRVYLPTSGEAPYPVVVYFHGGGWVFGDLDTHDSVCREIANRSACAVVSVGYRRSPEHKFPDPLEDCYGAVRWVSEPGTAARLQIDPDRIAVAGDSAGGNMAAVVCLLARERGGPKISAQVLICPVTAHEPDTPSYRDNATGNGLDASFMPWMWEQYLRSPEDGADPHVAPIRARDLAHLPTALVITAEFDLLRDEGEEYGERLRAAGVEAEVTRYPRMPHGFLDYRGIVDEGWDALDQIGEMLQRVFQRGGPAPVQ